MTIASEGFESPLRFYLSPRSPVFWKRVIRTLGVYALVKWRWDNTIVVTSTDVRILKGHVFSPHAHRRIVLNRAEEMDISQSFTERILWYADIDVMTEGKNKTSESVTVHDVQFGNFVMAALSLVAARNSNRPSEQLEREFNILRPVAFTARQRLLSTIVSVFTGLSIIIVPLIVILAIATQQPAILMFLPLHYIVAILGPVALG